MKWLIPSIDIYYESLVDDVDVQLRKLFNFFGVELIIVKELSSCFSQEIFTCLLPDNYFST